MCSERARFRKWEMFTFLRLARRRIRRDDLQKVLTGFLFDNRLQIHLKKFTADSCDDAWDPLHGAELLPGLSRHHASSQLSPRIPQPLDHSRHRQLVKRRQSRSPSKSNNELLPSQLNASATSALSRTSTMADRKSVV